MTKRPAAVTLMTNVWQAKKERLMQWSHADLAEMVIAEGSRFDAVAERERDLAARNQRLLGEVEGLEAKAEELRTKVDSLAYRLKRVTGALARLQAKAAPKRVKRRR